MPEGLVPGSVRLWHAGLKLIRARGATTADLAGPRPNANPSANPSANP
jgi:hypothetical protein